jgi:hypothetical protein
MNTSAKNPITVEEAFPILQNGLQSFLIFHEILIVNRIGQHKKEEEQLGN